MSDETLKHLPDDVSYSKTPAIETRENVRVGELFNGNDGSIWCAFRVNEGEGPEGYLNGVPVRFEKVSDD